MTQTMPAAVAPSPTSGPAPATDWITERMLLDNISWDTYTRLLDDIGDGAPRLTYDRGLLEIEVPSRHHELIKRFVGEMVETSLKKLSVDYEPAGSATWREEKQLQGLEADECYHIQHAAQVRGKIELDLSIDPPPDLAIEIEVTSHVINKLEVYKSLRVPEIWRVRPDLQCEMIQRQADGSYAATTVSACLPMLTPAIVSRYVQLRDQVGHSEALRQFVSEVLTTG